MTWSRSGAAARRPAPGLAAALGQFAHTQDIGLALSHRDNAPGIEKIEGVGGLDALVVGRKRQLVATFLLACLEQRLAGLLGVDEMAVQRLGVGVLEIVAGKLLLGLEEDIAIGDVTAIEELLTAVPMENLVAYLPEEDFLETTLGKHLLKEKVNEKL